MLTTLTTQSMMWIGFNLFVLVMLALDLGVFHRKAHAVTFKEAAGWSVCWVALALAFNLGLYVMMGAEAGTAFMTAYLIEKSLSVDNIFVFLTIFAYFRIPQQYQHKVLFWGILSALVMRAGFIFAGVVLIQKFHAMLYVFGALLIATAVKMVVHHGAEIDPERNPVVRLFRKLVPVTTSLEGGRFLTKVNGRWTATTLFLALVTIEVSDVIFAVDSIPAILAITSDPFIIYTSNVFAILGLRSLYFMLAGAIETFAYLHYGLAGILAFVGAKMLMSDIYKVPIGWALGVVATMLGLSIAASLVAKSKQKKAAERAAFAPETQGELYDKHS